MSNNLLHISFPINMFSSYRAELMGVAIFGVLWGHIMNETWQPVLLSQLARLVHTAGFIFLSGFGLFYAYSKSSSLLSFYRRRITRLVIPFILLTYWFFMAALFTGVDSIPKFIANISAIAFWIYGEAHSWAMWYVSVTLLLSLMFPLFYSLIFRQRKRPVLYLILLIGIYLVFIGSIYHFFPTYWVNTEIGWTRVIIFLLGMYAGYLAQNNKELNLIQIIIYFPCGYCAGQCGTGGHPRRTLHRCGQRTQGGSGLGYGDALLSDQRL